MTTAFISDLHLTPDRPASTVMFEEFIAGAISTISTLYILGDLFEFWIGDDGAKALGHHPVERTLKDATDQGMKIFFIHGNRDFLVGSEFSERTGCTILDDPTVIDLGELKVLLTHGDALCTDDTEHQNARGQMLSSKWKMAFLQDGLEKRLEKANALRQQSEVNKQSKSMDIMDVNQQAVEELLREHQVNIMIHGHTHKPAAHEFILDGQLTRRYVLGDWYTQKSAIFYENGKIVLRR